MRQLLIVVLFGVSVSPALAQEEAQTAPAAPPDAAAPTPSPARENVLMTTAQWIQNRYGNQSKDGFYPEFGGLAPGSGITAGPGFRRQLFNGGPVFDARAVIGWSTSTLGQARVQWPRLAGGRLHVGAQARWQDFTRVAFFGIGQTSLEADRSDFRLKNQDYGGFASFTPRDWLSVGGSVGYSPRVNIDTPTHTTDPATQDLFTEATAPGLNDHPAFIHSDAYVDIDKRNHPFHPTSGGDYYVTFLNFSDRDLDRFSFRRFEAQASQYFPILRHSVIAVRGRVAGSDTGSGNEVPFYLLPTLGSSRTLRGYADYRFRDRNLLLMNAEYRWTVFGALDTALFYDAGKVTPRFGDLDFSHLKTSYGVGLRFHSNTTTFARLDVGHSQEGSRLLVSFNEVFMPGHGSIVIPYAP